MRKLKKKKKHVPRHRKPKRPHYRTPRTPEEKVLRTLSRRVLKTLANKGFPSIADPLEFLGCSPEQLIRHLTKPHGGVWGSMTIDHIVPISIGQNQVEVRKLSHYSNLRLLSEQENMAKGSIIATDEQLAIAFKLLGRHIQKTIRVFVPHVIIPRPKPLEDRIFGAFLSIVNKC